MRIQFVNQGTPEEMAAHALKAIQGAAVKELAAWKLPNEGRDLSEISRNGLDSLKKDGFSRDYSATIQAGR